MADLSAQLYGGSDLTTQPGDSTKTGVPPNPLFSQGANLDNYYALPDKVKPMVNMIYEGRIPAAGRGGLSRNVLTQLIGLTSNIDPTFDATTFNSRQKTAADFSAGGASGQKFQSLSRNMNHMQNFERDFNKLNNSDALGGGFNYIANRVLPVMGDSKKQGALGSTGADITALSGELANAFRQTGMAEADINEWRKSLSTDSTPAFTKGAVESTIKLMEGRFQPQIDAYNNTMGTHKTLSDFMSPDARVVFDRINRGDALNPPPIIPASSDNIKIYPSTTTPKPDATGQKSAAPIKIKNNADYSNLPSGVEFIDPFGKKRVKP